MDLLGLGGTELVDKNGRKVLARDVLKNKAGVGFYFSAHWCPPCRQFTPRLAQAYADSRNPGSGNGIEIIFVSSDRTEQEFLSYMKESHGNWFGLVPGSPISQHLSSHFSVRGIPALKVIGLDGSVISEDGRQDVLSLGGNAFSQWERLAPQPIDTSIVNLLLDNDPSVKTDACDILVRLLANIVKNPNNIKYRQVKLTNPKIETKLLPAAGAFEVLFSVGYEEADDSLILPLSVPISKVEKFKEAIEKLIKSGNEASPAGPSSGASGSSGPSPGASGASPGASGTSLAGSSTTGSSLGASGSGSSSSNLPASTNTGSTLMMPGVLVTEREFHLKLLAGLQHMDAFEDPLAQTAARSVMPVEKFEKEAKAKFNSAKAADKSISERLLRDLVLLEFKEWFKTDFFKWVDSPKCESCGGDTVGGGMLAPTHQEQLDGAGRIEGYTCKECSSQVRFPRYHAKPAKLLETRRGRCGEWANCFVLCCRALGFDTRHVHDWTDHVWSEVWSEAEQRWLHVDPGEAVDKPLVYEAGWGKKLTYVIASSKDEIQDVTWRYSKDHAVTKQRRNLARPKWLTKTLLELTNKKQAGYPEEERRRLNQRRLADCLEMITARSVGEDDKVGRKTGSLAWRLARGELGETPSKEVVFTPTSQDVERGSFSLQFFVAEDYYQLGDGSRMEGWKSGVHQSQNIARKVEGDWNKAYLSRTEGNNEKGSIAWKFKVPEGYACGQIELLVTSTVFKTGRVIWQLCGDSSCLLPQPGSTMKTEQLNGSRDLKLSAMMSGGEGDLAWQHTQLFRCDRDETAPNMNISIQIKKI